MSGVSVPHSCYAGHAVHTPDSKEQGQDWCHASSWCTRTEYKRQEENVRIMITLFLVCHF